MGGVQVQEDRGWGRRVLKGFGYGFLCHNELFCHRERSDPRKLVPCHVLCSCVSVSVSASFPVL